MQSALGQIYLSNGDRARAEALIRQAVASQRAYGRDSMDLATHLETLGRVLNSGQEYASAESAAVEARAIRARVNPGVVDQEATATLGAALMSMERYDEAERVFRELAAVQQTHAQLTPGTSAKMLLGETLRRQGRNEEASHLFREEISQLRRDADVDSGDLALGPRFAAAAQGMMGHGSVSDSLWVESYRAYDGSEPIRFQRIARGGIQANRAELAARTGDDARAKPLADSARALWKGYLLSGDYRWASLARVDALMLRDHNQPAAAAARLIAELDTLRSRPHPNLYVYRRTEAVLADVYDRWGQPDSAAAHRALSQPGLRSRWHWRRRRHPP